MIEAERFLRILANGKGGANRVVFLIAFVIAICIGCLIAWYEHTFEYDAIDDIKGVTDFGRLWIAVHIVAVVIWGTWAFSHLWY